MTTNEPSEIGILIYPGVQMAAVLGMADLFQAANGVGGANKPRLRVSHWEFLEGRNAPIRVFDSFPHPKGDPAVLVVPPAFGQPISQEVARRYTA